MASLPARWLPVPAAARALRPRAWNAPPQSGSSGAQQMVGKDLGRIAACTSDMQSDNVSATWFSAPRQSGRSGAQQTLCTMHAEHAELHDVSKTVCSSCISPVVQPKALKVVAEGLRTADILQIACGHAEVRGTSNMLRSCYSAATALSTNGRSASSAATDSKLFTVIMNGQASIFCILRHSMHCEGKARTHTPQRPARRTFRVCVSCSVLCFSCSDTSLIAACMRV